MALRNLSAERRFYISLIAAVLLLILLILNCLTALQTGGKLQVIAQFFPANLREFSHLNTLSALDSVRKRRDREKIDEMLVRYYLEMRYTQIPDRNEMLYRWGRGGPLYLLSLPSLYAEFVKDFDHKLESIRNVQTIKIIKVEKDQDNVFRVNFFIYEHIPQKAPIEKEKTATITFGYEPKRIRHSSVFSNPYGLMVIRFHES